MEMFFIWMGLCQLNDIKMEFNNAENSLYLQIRNCKLIHYLLLSFQHSIIENNYFTARYIIKNNTCICINV